MEEDIKILEEMCNEIINEDSCNLFETLSPYEIALKIKNLIKGYRELENKSEEQAKFIENIQDNMGHKGMTKTELAFVCASLEYDNKELEEDLKNSIPKSKVEELHKEYYEKAFAEPYDCTTADYKHSQAMGGWRALNKLLMEDK